MHKDPMRKYTIAGASAFAVGMCSILWQFIIILAMNGENQPDSRECRTPPEQLAPHKTEEIVQKSSIRIEVGDIPNTGDGLQSGHR